MAIDSTGISIYVKNAEDPILSAFLQAVPFDQYGTIMTGIKQDQQIVFIDNLPDMVLADAACGTGTPVSATMSQKLWEPKAFRGDVEQCEVDLRNVALFRQASADAAGRPDLTENDVFFAIITELLSRRAAFDAHKIAWFADTAAASPPLTNAGLIPYFNLIDGLWAQFDAAVTAGDMTRVTIAANAEATTAAQLANLTAADAYAAFEEVIDSADPRLFQSQYTPVIVATRTMVRALKRYMRGQGVDLSFARIEVDQGQLSFDGIPIVEEAAWDSTIASAFDNGTTLDRPHRIVLTAKENVQLGLGSGEDIMQLKQGYDERDEVYYGKVKGWIDAKYMFDYLTVVAY
jgi:hypothetical protein